MSEYLGHLIAFLVVATLSVAFLTVRQRSQQQAVTAAAAYAAKTQARSFADFLGYDLDNLRGQPRAEAALGAYDCAVEADGGLTTQFTFPTLDRPAPGTAAEVVQVTYAVTPTDDSVRVGARWMPTYHLSRSVDRGSGPEPEGGAALLAELEVALVGQNGDTVTDGPAPADLREVRVAYAFAAPTPERLTGDQRNLGTSNLTRFGGTFRPSGLTRTR